MISPTTGTNCFRVKFHSYSIALRIEEIVLGSKNAVTSRLQVKKRLAEFEKGMPGDKGDTRRQILVATLKVIARGGVDSVTHRRVAEAAGVSLSSTTYHFDSRKHLLREAFALYLDWNGKMLRDLSINISILTVQDFVEFVVAVNDRDYIGFGLLLAEYELTLFAARDSDIAELLHEWDNNSLAQFAQALERLGAKAPFDGARTVLHLLRGYELERLTFHKPATSELKRRLTLVVSAYINQSAVKR